MGSNKLVFNPLKVWLVFFLDGQLIQMWEIVLTLSNDSFSHFIYFQILITSELPIPDIELLLSLFKFCFHDQCLFHAAFPHPFSVTSICNRTLDMSFKVQFNNTWT